MKIGFIGVGKLGKPIAEIIAQYHDVIGYDINKVKPDNFLMTDKIEEAVKGKDFIFIAVPTPHNIEYGGEKPTSHLKPKNFDYSIVQTVLKEINQYVTKNQLVVLISTVLPGTVRRHLKPLIPNARFVYNPYLIAMGTVKRDFLNPEMIIIGTEDGKITTDAKQLMDFYDPIMQNNPRYEIGTWDEAESIKIFYNTFISAKIGLVNMIQDVAMENGNINVDVVTQALAKSTQRIMGPKYMTAGMGDGGSCHPRDNIALSWLSKELSLGYDLFGAIMSAREIQAKRLAQECLKYGTFVTIVGKAYKPGVPYIDGSYSLLVGYYITELGGTVSYYDPNTNDLEFKKTDVYLIGYWEDWVVGLEFPRESVVIDPWRKFYGNVRKIVHYGNTRQ